MGSKAVVLGVRVDGVTKDDLYEAIAGIIARNESTYLANVNIHAINIACRNPRFRDILNAAPLTYCDGEGVRLGARLLGVLLPPRIVLTYWIWELCAFCERQGFSIFLLGGQEGSAALAAERLTARYPRLRIAGTHHGYFEKEGEESEKVVARVREAAPDVLFVCFGMPLQEFWVHRNLPQLHAHVALFGGSTIEYTAGRKRFTPHWMTLTGLEWLFRLVQEPRRLWKRYLIGNPVFVVRVLLQRLHTSLR